MAPPDEAVLLVGYAYDPESGTLGAEDMWWESNRQGVLGTGSELQVASLLPGEHQITLTVADGDGMPASAGIEVFVGGQARLPLFVTQAR